MAPAGISWPFLLLTLVAGVSATGASAAASASGVQINGGNRKGKGGPKSHPKNDLALRYLITTHKGKQITQDDALSAIAKAGAPGGHKSLMKRYRMTDWETVRNATAPKASAGGNGKLKAPKKMRLSSKQKAGNERIDLETKKIEAEAFKAAVHAYHAGWKLRQAGVPGEGPQGKHLSARDYCWQIEAKEEFKLEKDTLSEVLVRRYRSKGWFDKDPPGRGGTTQFPTEFFAAASAQAGLNQVSFPFFRRRLLLTVPAGSQSRRSPSASSPSGGQAAAGLADSGPGLRAVLEV